MHDVDEEIYLHGLCGYRLAPRNMAPKMILMALNRYGAQIKAK